MSVKSQNRQYLKQITAEIKDIPRQLALRTGHNLLLKLVSLTHVDTGQAAANWHMSPYTSALDMKDQQMMWGSFPDFDNAVFPVLPKTSAEKNNIGTLVDYANARAHYVVQNSPKTISGVVVYNPITPGHSNFQPGNDSLYYQNALSEAESKWQAEYAEALSEAIEEMKLEFQALR